MPPNILDSLSTESTVAVRENQNITLTCKADGYPQPKLMWKREDGQVISLNKHHKGMSICQVFFYFQLCHHITIFDTFRMFYLTLRKSVTHRDIFKIVHFSHCKCERTRHNFVFEKSFIIINLPIADFICNINIHYLLLLMANFNLFFYALKIVKY